MKRIIPAWLLVLAMLTACGAQGSETSDTTEAPATDLTTEAVTEELPEVVSADYEGEEFHFLMQVIPQWPDKNDFGSGEMNGDVLNDAYFKRNKAVEEKLNITITNEHLNTDTDSFYLIQKYVLAGDEVYDAMLARGYNIFSMAQNNLLYNLNDLPKLDLTHSWWDSGANRDFSIGDKLYMTIGDISTIINDDTSVMLFNKALIEDFKLANPYELVKSGNWTFDEMHTLISAVAGDINGDGVYDKDDRYGAIIWDDSMMSIVNAVGERCCKFDENGELVLSLNTERVVNTVTKYLSIVDDTSICFAYQRETTDVDKIADSMFTGDRSLFFFELLNRMSFYRDMESDFGILPFPKLDAEQENYYSNVGAYPSVLLAVPCNVSDPERVGVVLDLLGCESQKTVRPAYYTSVLEGKYVRDYESVEMLDIIFANRVYDIGWFLQIGRYNEEIMNIYRKKQTNFSSMYAAHEEKALAQIEEFMENINSSEN